MILGIGIDLVELSIIKEKQSDRFIKRILSDLELKAYLKINNMDRRLTYIAGRFAVKEALFKK